MSDVCVRNVSTRGMLLQARVPPPEGTYIEIVMPGVSVVGRVVWTSERRFGIASRDKIKLSNFLGPTAGNDACAEPVVAQHARRAALAVHRGSQSRAHGGTMQFLFLLFCGALAAAAAAGIAFSALATLRDSVLTYL